MKCECPSGQDETGKARRARAAKPRAGLDRACVSINAGRSGEWIPAEELLETAKAALGRKKNVALNLDKIDHLDASALQILLALEAAEKGQGRQLQLVNASPNLERWFGYSGATGRFLITEQKTDE